jgi:hypothetical protein
MTVNVNGVIHGNTIKLERDAGLPDGQAVSVEVRPRENAETIPPLERLKRSFGACENEAAELDEFLLQVRKDRDAWGGQGTDE